MNFFIKNFYKVFVIVIIFLFNNVNLFSQKAPIKFGEIDLSDLLMNNYHEDSTAPAVILCSYGYFNGNDHYFTLIQRIKILKEEGKEYANFVFNTNNKSDIRGVTFNYENGKIVKSKLSPTQIYEEIVRKDYVRMKVAMPNVKVGSVIDIEFRHFLLPASWYFQSHIPIKMNVLILEESPYVSYKVKKYGFYQPKEIKTNYFVVERVPAFREEPYLSSDENYITKFEFEVESINIPGYFYKSYTTSWDAVLAYLRDHDNFGVAIEGSTYLKNVADNIKSIAKTPEEKIKLAFDAIQKEIRWNKDESLFASSNYLSEIYKTKTGNSADINLILLQLLRKLDLNANPVVMSSRDNGKMTFSPTIDKLNYVIVHVKTDNKDYLVDATEKYLPFFILPERALNGQGRLMDFKNNYSTWMTINTDKKDLITEVIDFMIKDNKIEGTITKTYYHYAAFNFRKEYNNYNSQNEYIEKKLILQNPDIQIESYSIENLDNIYENIIENIKFKMDFYDNSNVLAFNPFIIDVISKNPFNAENRIYPVEFPYLIERRKMINIQYDGNLIIEQLPKSVKVILPGDGGKFIYNIANANNNITIGATMSISKNMFYPDEYQYLREFFNQIIKKQIEQIVLKRSL